MLIFSLDIFPFPLLLHSNCVRMQKSERMYMMIGIMKKLRVSETEIVQLFIVRKSFVLKENLNGNVNIKSFFIHNFTMAFPIVFRKPCHFAFISLIPPVSLSSIQNILWTVYRCHRFCCYCCRFCFSRMNFSSFFRTRNLFEQMKFCIQFKTFHQMIKNIPTTKPHHILLIVLFSVLFWMKIEFIGFLCVYECLENACSYFKWL